MKARPPPGTVDDDAITAGRSYGANGRVRVWCWTTVPQVAAVDLASGGTGDAPEASMIPVHLVHVEGDGRLFCRVVHDPTAVVSEVRMSDDAGRPLYVEDLTDLQHDVRIAQQWLEQVRLHGTTAAGPPPHRQQPGHEQLPGHLW